MNVDDFIRLEVQHQGFDLETQEGQQRVEWMKEAWKYAQARADIKPTIKDMLAIGRLIEPVKANDFRVVHVQVGGNSCPHPMSVPSLIQHVWKRCGELTPLEFYRDFEFVHPFEDGNGRTGKVLLHWLNGKLDDPEMPPDLWGNGLP